MNILLINAIFGCGNANHDHVHRHNTLDITAQQIDQLKMEQFSGGVSAATINTVANQAGGLTARPTGFVNVEDGWNVRRGIGMLKFTLSENALVTTELTILGYLVGGTASVDGISADTVFVPVRSWETSTRNVSDTVGLPMATTAITGSSQFLMSDPTGINKLKSLRPLDIATESLGFLACEQEGVEATYAGTITADLSNSIQISKTNNLDPTHYARELVKLSTATIGQNQSFGIETALADGMNSPGLNECSIVENAFFRTMMYSIGVHSTAGFNGFSIGEINSVFETLPDVMHLSLLNTSNFAEVDNLFGSNEYGAANNHETIATEMAMLTVHLLIACGLTHLTFSATNNPHSFNGLEGVDDGVAFIYGQFGSVLDQDPNAINRVEKFQQLIKNNFFSKYSTGYAHNSTIISVSVSCFLFGETAVEIFFNGDETNSKNYVNATYLINRTSTNITNSEAGLQSSLNFVSNIKEYF